MGPLDKGGQPPFPAVAGERGGALVGPLGGCSVHVVSEGRVQGGVGVFPGWSRPSIRYVISSLIIRLCLWLTILIYWPRFIPFVLLAFASSLFLPFSPNLFSDAYSLSKPLFHLKSMIQLLLILWPYLNPSIPSLYLPIIFIAIVIIVVTYILLLQNIFILKIRIFIVCMVISRG